MLPFNRLSAAPITSLGSDDDDDRLKAQDAKLFLSKGSRVFYEQTGSWAK